MRNSVNSLLALQAFSIFVLEHAKKKKRFGRALQTSGCTVPFFAEVHHPSAQASCPTEVEGTWVRVRRAQTLPAPGYPQSVA